jgi:hypothetical protein
MRGGEAGASCFSGRETPATRNVIALEGVSIEDSKDARQDALGDCIDGYE